MSDQHLKKLGKISHVPSGWEITTVGKACKVRNDLRKPISVDERKGMQGKYPYYGPTGILDFIDHHRVDGKYALIGEDGDHYLKPTEKPQTILAEGQFNVNNHAHIIEGTSKCLTEWFYIYFHNRDITHMLSRQGANRYKLNKETLTSLPILLPSVSQQSEIYEIFQSCVFAVEKTEALIDAKERQFGWLVTRLLDNRSNDQDWDKYSFGDIFAPFKEVNKNNEDLEVLSVTKDGIVSQSEYFNKEVASEDKSKYLIVRRGSLVMSGLNFWMGSIDFQDIRDVGIVSPAYKTFKINSGNFDERYLRFFVRSKYMRKILMGASVQGASVVRRNLDKDMLVNSAIHLPPMQKQQEIAELLGSAETEIILLKKLADQYRTQKRGLMQKLLSGEWHIKNKEAA